VFSCAGIAVLDWADTAQEGQKTPTLISTTVPTVAIVGLIVNSDSL
jgi:hypothetical protein